MQMTAHGDGDFFKVHDDSGAPEIAGRLMHEVLPVQVPSGEFADWRFTVNGWLHR